MPTRITTNSRIHSRPLISVPRLDLSVQFAVTRGGLPAAARFKQWARAALLEDASVTLRLVDRAEALELNSTYRGKHYATNVLSFAYPDTRPLSGDIVICIPVVKTEARHQGKSIQAHLAHLTVHGMLHLQGFDHETEDDAELMEGLETEIVSKLGYADPYAGASA